MRPGRSPGCGPHGVRSTRRKGLVVGLTGGIGSGKSVVASMFAARGIPVFDADDASREVTRPGGAAFDAVVAAFGLSVVRPDGTLDRTQLAARVFADAAARRSLESIVHPLVDAARRRWIERRVRAGCPLCIYSAPLLLEVGHDRGLDGVLVVVCDLEARVRRVALRDGVDPERVRERIRAQMSDDERIARATHVIPNDGTIEELRARVDAALETLAAGRPSAPAAGKARR